MLQAFVDDGNEILVPAPDYPLWTGAITLCGGKPVHYLCDEDNEWNPDLADIESKITENTHALVIINPNNPTGAVYSKEIVEGMVDIARRHDLVVFADEIYEKILFDDAVHHHAAKAAGNDVLCLTFSGLSKAYRVCGYRTGWVMISGPKEIAADFLEGLTLVANMRMCANVPAQHAIQTALGGYQSIEELIVPGGRFYEQSMLAHRLLNEIPGVSSVKPHGALYCFPRLDPEVYPIENDEMFVIELLRAKKILVTHGTGFNWPEPGPLPAGHPSGRRRARGGDRPDRRLPRYASLSHQPQPQEPLLARPHLPARHPDREDRVPAARPEVRHVGHRARPAHRWRDARGQPHRLRRLRLRRAGRQPVRAQGAVHGQARDLRQQVRRSADAVDAPHRGRPRRRPGVVPDGGGLPQDGEAVGIFPEATISRAMELKEFKTGAVRIAAEAGVPLVPVILWGTQRMMTKDHPKDFSRGKTIAIRVGPPLHPTGADSGRRDRRAAPGDELHARRDDPQPTRPTSSPRAPGGCRPGTAAAHPRSRRPRVSTPQEKRDRAERRRQRQADK